MQRRFNVLKEYKREGKKGKIGSLDVKLIKREKRKLKRKRSIQVDINESDDEAGVVNEPLVELSDVMVTLDDKEYLHYEPKKCDHKNIAIPDRCYLIADKYGISNRALTELAAGFLAPGSNIDDFNLSVKTTERMRNKVRSENAKAYKTNQLNNQDETFYTLHWDSKRMKSLSHTQADKERIAVVLTGR